MPAGYQGRAANSGRWQFCSTGVICPPAGIDRDMEVTPPSGGHLKIIPPPGTPGGDPNVQPK
jgi:hypothetical protein